VPGMGSGALGEAVGIRSATVYTLYLVSITHLM